MNIEQLQKTLDEFNSVKIPTYIQPNFPSIDLTNYLPQQPEFKRAMINDYYSQEVQDFNKSDYQQDQSLFQILNIYRQQHEYDQEFKIEQFLKFFENNMIEDSDQYEYSPDLSTEDSETSSQTEEDSLLSDDVIKNFKEPKEDKKNEKLIQQQIQQRQKELQNSQLISSINSGQNMQFNQINNKEQNNMESRNMYLSTQCSCEQIQDDELERKIQQTDDIDKKLKLNQKEQKISKSQQKGKLPKEFSQLLPDIATQQSLKEAAQKQKVQKVQKEQKVKKEQITLPKIKQEQLEQTSKKYKEWNEEQLSQSQAQLERILLLQGQGNSYQNIQNSNVYESPVQYKSKIDNDLQRSKQNELNVSQLSRQIQIQHPQKPQQGPQSFLEQLQQISKQVGVSN